MYIVTLALGAPDRSAAAIAMSRDARAHTVHPGQWIGEHEVLAITDDWTGAHPHVWLRRGIEVCRATLNGNPARVVAPPVKQKRAIQRRRRRAR